MLSKTYCCWVRSLQLRWTLVCGVQLQCRALRTPGWTFVQESDWRPDVHVASLLSRQKYSWFPTDRHIRTDCQCVLTDVLVGVGLVVLVVCCRRRSSCCTCCNPTALWSSTCTVPVQRTWHCCTYVRYCYTIGLRYDTIRQDSVYLTWGKKLTDSRPSLPHGMDTKCNGG